jgi:ribosomal protein L16 Arg81 hydroxylase
MLESGSLGFVHVDSQSTPELGPPWSFESLVRPVSALQFCRGYWARRPLHVVRGNSDYYRKLISLAEIEQYLSIDELFLRELAATPFRSEGLPDAPPRCASEVYERLAQGKPLRLRRLETVMHPASPVIAMLRDMELTLQHPKASFSCYIAPPDGLGLGPHHDESEIFTLQIRGAKKWRLFHKVVADEPCIYEPDELGAPEQQLTLQAGDLLYIPSGHVHDVAVVDSEPSFSLTIVFEPFRWRALLDLLAARLGETDPFTEPVPAGPRQAEDSGDPFKREFEVRIALIRQALADLTEENFADALASRHLRRMTLPPGDRIDSIFRIDDIGLDTLVELLPGVACRITRSNGRVLIGLAGGYTLQAGAGAEPALRDILAARHPFPVSGIHHCLSAPAKIALAKRLVGCGLLRMLPKG